MQATRADVVGAWRDAVNRLEKFKASLAVRLPDAWPDDQVEAFVNYWADSIRLAWISNTPKASRAALLDRIMHRWILIILCFPNGAFTVCDIGGRRGKRTERCTCAACRPHACMMPACLLPDNRKVKSIIFRDLRTMAAQMSLSLIKQPLLQYSGAHGSQGTPSTSHSTT